MGWLDRGDLMIISDCESFMKRSAGLWIKRRVFASYLIPAINASSGPGTGSLG